MTESVILVGAGGHARVIADILACQGVGLLGFLDDNPVASIGLLPRLGAVEDAEKFSHQARFVLSIGSNHLRQRIGEEMANRLCFATAVHPKAVIAKDVRIGEGTVIMAGAVVNPGTIIGRHCIVNTASSIDHDCVLEDYVHVSPGATIAGTVHIGSCSWIGAGSVVINNKQICSGVVIGAGAVVISDISSSGTYVGVPARNL